MKQQTDPRPPVSTPSSKERMSRGRFSWLGQERRFFLEILTLTSFAIAQPILDVFGKSPETFLFTRSGRSQIALFALAVTFVPPLVVWIAAMATRAGGPSVRRLVQHTAIGGFLVVIALQFLKRGLPLRGIPLVVAAVAAGVLLAWLLIRSDGARRWLSYAWPASVAFVLIFLLISPVSKLVRPAAAGEAAQTSAPVPIIMVLFDQFPMLTLLDESGRISEDLYPNLAELAGQATWFRNYTVTESRTRYSVPTILTGRLAAEPGKDPIATDYPDNMFSLLRDTHRLNVFETVTQLCAPDVCSEEAALDTEGTEASAPAPAPRAAPLLARTAVEVWRDVTFPGDTDRDITAQFVEQPEPRAPASPAPRETDGTNIPGGRRDQRGPGAFEALLNTFSKGEKPGLYYAHLMLPHLPWRFFASGAEYQIVHRKRGDLALDADRDPWAWVEEEWPVQLARQRHILQAQYVDTLVGRMVERLKETGIYDDALIILTSDHGVSLQPGRSRESDQNNLHELYWVPMIFKQPGQREGETVDRHLTSPNLLPSIADVLGLKIPWQTSGRSMLDPRTDDGPITSITRRWRKKPGKPQQVAVADAERRMRLETFVPQGTSSDPARLPFLVGPGARLIGRPVSSFTVGPASGRTASLALPSDLTPAPGKPLPALVWGAVQGIGPQSRVAVAMNGTIGGVSTTWTQDRVPGWFGALIPEDLIREGKNRLQVFELDGDTLRPIEVVFQDPLAP